jgi:hypothetical protein
VKLFKQSPEKGDENSTEDERQEEVRGMDPSKINNTTRQNHRREKKSVEC